MAPDENKSLEGLTLLRVYTVRDAPEAEIRTVYANQDFQLIARISKEGVSYDNFNVTHLPPKADIPERISLFPSNVEEGNAFRATRAVNVVSYTVVPADAIDDLVAVYLGGVELHAARKGAVDDKERRYQAEIAGLRTSLVPVPEIPELLRLHPELQGEAYTKSLDQLTRQAAAVYLTDRVTEKLGSGPVIPRPVSGEDPEVRLGNVLDVYRQNQLLRTVLEFSDTDLTLFISRAGTGDVYLLNKDGVIQVNPKLGGSEVRYSSGQLVARDILKDGSTSARKASRQIEAQVRSYLSGLIQAAK